MPLVQKTFAFASDAEGLVDQSGGGQNAIFAWEGTDGNPAGSIKWTQATKQVTVSGPARQGTGITWQTWGVPANATVNTVRVVSYSRKVAANTKLTSHDHRIRIVDPTTFTFVHGANNLASETLPTAVGGWLAGGGIATAQTVGSTWKPASSGVALEHHYGVVTSGGGGGAAVDARFDQIVIEIDYTEGAAANNYTRAETGALSFGGALSTTHTVAPQTYPHAETASVAFSGALTTTHTPAGAAEPALKVTVIYAEV